MDHLFFFNYQKNVSPDEEAYWFIFRKEKVLTMMDGEARKPLLIRGRNLPGLNMEKAIQAGQLNQINCYAVMDSAENTLDISNTEWVSLRLSYGKFEEGMFQVFARALHLALWSENCRFCGRCGTQMELKSNERCFACPSCGFISYPRISPAVIVSVEKDGKLLLARAKRFQGVMYSVLAGFVEPGESLEDCIRREIKEETGIEVKNIRYFKSQPWPFPDSLMIAFTAEYAGGTLTIDQEEIVEARWYRPEEFPAIPGKVSVARALIDHFVNRHAKKEP